MGRAVLAMGLVPFVVAILLGMISLWNSAGRIAELRGRYQVYREAGVRVCANTAEEASIAVPEIGIIGWLCNHRIIDPYGLVTPEMPHSSRGSIAWRDWLPFDRRLSSSRIIRPTRRPSCRM